MDRRTFIASIAGSSLVPLFSSAAIGTSANRKGFMISTGDIATIRADITRIADLGGTIVRFPLYFSFEPSLQVWFDRLEAAYTISSQRGVILVIDIHHPTNSPDPAIQKTIQNIDDFVNKWSAIAQRFANRRRIWYDLCNEPQSRTPQNIAWRDVALRAAQAIRNYDGRNRIVFAAPGTTTSSASNFRPLAGINNQILQFHFYDWIDVQCPSPYQEPVQNPPVLKPQCTSERIASYPSLNRTREDLQRKLQQVANAGKNGGVPVYIGEVAIPYFHPNAPRFLRDFTSICDQLGIHLTIHAYREADIWNYENNPRAWQILTSWLR